MRQYQHAKLLEVQIFFSLHNEFEIGIISMKKPPAVKVGTLSYMEWFYSESGPFGGQKNCCALKTC